MQERSTNAGPCIFECNTKATAHVMHCVHVYVSVCGKRRETERDRARERGTERERGSERESVCVRARVREIAYSNAAQMPLPTRYTVSVCVCVCVCVCV